MKLRATKKEILNSGKTILKIGYCQAQHLLRFKEPYAYTAGGYGWDADFYDIGGGVVLSTGYRPTGRAVSYELVKKYNELAQAVSDSGATYEQKAAQVNELLQAFINEALQNAK